MRTPVVITLAAVAMAISLTAGAALASAGQSDARAAAERAGGFEIEIDPDLDARFGPRVLNAAEAADIVTSRFPGARVIKVELDKDNKRPVWEVEADRAGDGFKVDVDATDGSILR